MKLFYKSLLAVMVVLFGLNTSKAANYAWPSNFEGVMLQGFYWDSYNGTDNTKWTTLTSKCDELSSYFKVIWVPNSAKAASNPSNGYDPVYWFTNHNSSFGTEAEIRALIKAYRAKGVDIMEDVVINHRSGVSNWTNFPSETWNGKTYKLGPEHICNTDEVKNASGQAKPTGAADTGEDFAGSRDLDHTNATVQENCKAYCTFLLQDMGYAGFRYDMVKGYAGRFTKMYNEASKPKYSVGEYWDGNYDAVAAWIESTGRQSAAFDFPCKYAINEAFHSNDLTKLVWKANGTTDQPAGLIHFGYPQYAVTFVDNHDTYRDGSKFNGNVVAANAFILCSPGTPCVFWPHYSANKAAIQALINVRNSVGVHNQSAVKVLKTSRDCYMAEVTGTKGKLVVKIGSTMDSPSGYSNSDIKASGNGYCVWTKTNVQGGTTGGDTPQPSGDPFKVYFDNSSANWTTPYIHYWGGAESTWPGVAMSKVAGSDNVWEYTVPAGTTGILFNAGDGDASKTPDFVAAANHIYSKTGDGGVYSGGNGGGNGGGTTVTTDPFKIFWDNSVAKWNTPYVHYWGATESTWPGVAMSKVAGADDMWEYTVPAGTTGLVFNAGDGDASKTSDYVAVPNHKYTQAGDQGVYGNGGNTGGGGNGGNTGGDGNYPANLYLVGNVDGTSWATAHGVAQDIAKDGVYTWYEVEIGDAGAGLGYFTFLTALDNVDEEWDGANQADRYGAPAKDTKVTLNTPADIKKYTYMVDAMAAESWCAAPGKYRLTADLKNMKLTLSTATGVEEIEISDIKPAYFNLQGQKVENPAPGIYIVVRGGKSQKVLVK